MKACEALGVENVVFGDFPDQRLDTFPLLELTRAVEDCINRFQPETVLMHFAEDVNEDHRVAFRATLAAVRPVPGAFVRNVACYETPSSTDWAPPLPGSTFAPNVFVDITDSLDKKLEALSMYEDTYYKEVKAFPHPRSYDGIRTYARRCGSLAGVEAAEPFLLLRQVI